jgi:hypothetical protein
MSTATITAPDVATPVLQVGQPLPLAGTDLGAALGTALTELFGSATGPPVTAQLAYGHELVGGASQLVAGRALPTPAAGAGDRDRGGASGIGLDRLGPPEPDRRRLVGLVGGVLEPSRTHQPAPPGARPARLHRPDRILVTDSPDDQGRAASER